MLGGGLVPGSVVLLAGEPGVGKSTLLLEVAHRWAQSGRRALYISGEESAGQIRLRADRIDCGGDDVYLAAVSDVHTVLEHIDTVRPDLVINPVKIAEASWYLHTQDRSCWTHELQLTPFPTKPSH